MRDISELGEVMRVFDVPHDVRSFVENESVSVTLHYLWVAVFIGIMLLAMLVGLWTFTQLGTPFRDLEACANEHRIAPILGMLASMFSGIPLAGIGVTYIAAWSPRRHKVSLFACGFLNENNDPYSAFFVRRLNRNRPIGETPEAYIQRGAEIWLPYAWLATAFAIALAIIGIIWSNAVC